MTEDTSLPCTRLKLSTIFSLSSGTFSFTVRKTNSRTFECTTAVESRSRVAGDSVWDRFFDVFRCMERLGSIFFYSDGPVCRVQMVVFDHLFLLNGSFPHPDCPGWRLLESRAFIVIAAPRSRSNALGKPGVACGGSSSMSLRSQELTKPGREKGPS